MERSYYLCSENKGADQLRGYREADLRLCVRICKMPVFSRRGSFVLDERHNCTFGKKSGVYGGENFYRYICDTSAEECQESCHKDHYCAVVSHTVHGDMNHCRLYTKDDASAIEDSGSTLWMKYCMNGVYFVYPQPLFGY